MRAASALLRATTLALIVALLAPSIALAQATLENPSVSPNPGTPGTTFTFRVEYTSDTMFPADVDVVVAGEEVPLTLDLEQSTFETLVYVGTSNLPAGEWPTLFRARARGNGDAEVAGPTVIVRSNTPPPTTRPTPPPTPVPTPPPTPVPTPPPTPTPTPTPDPTPGGGIFTPSPTPSDSPTPRETSTPSATPDLDAEPASAGLDLGPLAMLFLGGTAAGSGAALLLVQWLGDRGQRPGQARTRRV